MSHDEYVKRRDEIMYSLTHELTKKTYLKAEHDIDELVLAVIGKDLSINNPTEGQRDRLRHAYAIRDKQRSIVKGDI